MYRRNGRGGGKTVLIILFRFGLATGARNMIDK